MFNRPKKYNKQSGNALVIILIAVALFAALSFVLSQGSRTGESDLSEQQASLLATEILDYSNAIRNAVRQIKIQGCQDEEISFENSAVTLYTNAGAPADNTCHVFHPSGGGQVYLAPNRSALNTGLSSETNLYFGEWSFFGRHCIADIGTCATNAHLMLNLSQIQDAVCNEINNRANIAALPLVNWDVSKTATSEFTGTYTVNAGTELTEANLDSRTFGCFQDNAGDGDGHNVFFQILIAR